MRYKNIVTTDHILHKEHGMIYAPPGFYGSYSKPKAMFHRKDIADRNHHRLVSEKDIFQILIRKTYAGKEYNSLQAHDIWG